MNNLDEQIIKTVVSVRSSFVNFLELFRFSTPVVFLIISRAKLHLARTTERLAQVPACRASKDSSAGEICHCLGHKLVATLILFA